MRSGFMVAACLASALGLGGCATGLKGEPERTIDEKLATSCPVTVTNATGVSSLAASRSAYDGEPIANAANRQVYRNRFIDRCLGAIDGSYGAFSQSLRSDQKSFAIGTETLAAGLTGAAALAKSARTKTFLATYATFALGLKGTVDKELFLNQALTALKAQMEASRTQILVGITQGKASPDTEYSLDTALVDLKAYYYAGTLDGALASVAEDAGAKAGVAQEQIAKVKTVKYATDATHKTLFKYLLPDGLHIDPKSDAVLLSCAQTVLGAAVTKTQLYDTILNGERRLSTDQRTALISCAKQNDPNFDRVTQ